MAKKNIRKYSQNICKIYSITSLISFDKSVACHLTPVLPTFYDECKGLSAKMLPALAAPQNTMSLTLFNSRKLLVYSKKIKYHYN